jgi:hypothetical protein
LVYSQSCLNFLRVIVDLATSQIWKRENHEPTLGKGKLQLYNNLNKWNVDKFEICAKVVWNTNDISRIQQKG